MITAYYNEIDPKAAAWLRQLIKNGDITPGEVDERSITEVRPGDLIGFNRCHFFTGVGTWDYCLNKAGWGDKPVWTASLPCQPFSAAGKGLGKDDERHLLPHYIDLVRQCRPNVQIGEQVERAIAHGWLDDLQANMEAEGYVVGHCVLGAHSVNAPHIRQRLYWLAHTQSERNGRASSSSYSASREAEDSRRQENRESSEFIAGSAVIGMADTNIAGLEGWQGTERSDKFAAGQDGMVSGMADSKSSGLKAPSQKCGEQSSERQADALSTCGGVKWIYCRDNKYRPIESSIFPLVDGIAKGMVHCSDPVAPINANATQEARVMRLKGYGNAIQAQTAIAFINAYMGVMGSE